MADRYGRKGRCPISISLREASDAGSAPATRVQHVQLYRAADFQKGSGSAKAAAKRDFDRRSEIMPPASPYLHLRETAEPSTLIPRHHSRRLRVDNHGIRPGSFLRSPRFVHRGTAFSLNLRCHLGRKGRRDISSVRFKLSLFNIPRGKHVLLFYIGKKVWFS